MLTTKATKCDRCGGWLQPQDDHYGQYFTCINCGHVHEQQPTGAPLPLPVLGSRRPRHNGAIL